MSSVADGTRPTTSAWGTSVTPGNNAYGSYTEVMSDTLVTDEAYMIEIMITDNFVAAAARDTLVTIGFDFSGGVTYTDMEISHLLASCAGDLSAGRTGGVIYRFPIRVPAGTAIAAKASINNATVGTLRVACVLYGRPTRKDLIRYGSFVHTYGAVTASSSGTSVTAGTTSEGAWANLGTLSNDIWAWELGVGINNTAMNSAILHAELGVGSTQKVVIPNVAIATNTDERLHKPAALLNGNAKSGEAVYGRLQTSGAVTAYSMIAYGVGG